MTHVLDDRTEVGFAQQPLLVGVEPSREDDPQTRGERVPPLDQVAQPSEQRRRVASPAPAQLAGMDDVDPLRIERRMRHLVQMRVERRIPAVGHVFASAASRAERSFAIGRVTPITPSAECDHARSRSASSRSWAAVGHAARSGSKRHPSRKSAIHAGRRRPSSRRQQVSGVRGAAADHAFDLLLPDQATRARQRAEHPGEQMLVGDEHIREQTRHGLADGAARRSGPRSPRPSARRSQRPQPHRGVRRPMARRRATNRSRSK